MKLSKKKIISVVIVIFVVVVLAKASFNFLARRTTTAAFSPCEYNLQVIEICKSNWKTVNNKTASDVPSWDDLRSELRPYADRYGWTNGMPVCPDGGTYIIGRVDERPRCSIGGPRHSLP